VLFGLVVLPIAISIFLLQKKLQIVAPLILGQS